MTSRPHSAVASRPAPGLLPEAPDRPAPGRVRDAVLADPPAVSPTLTGTCDVTVHPTNLRRPRGA